MLSLLEYFDWGQSFCGHPPRPALPISLLAAGSGLSLSLSCTGTTCFFELYAFIILTSTLVLGINYFVIMCTRMQNAGDRGIEKTFPNFRPRGAEIVRTQNSCSSRNSECSNENSEHEHEHRSLLHHRIIAIIRYDSYAQHDWFEVRIF